MTQLIVGCGTDSLGKKAKSETIKLIQIVDR